MHFKDGTTATCDLLVGCDGIHSTVRSTMLAAVSTDMVKAGRHEDAAQALAGITPKWTGTVLYRCLIPREEFAREFPGHRALSDNIMVRFILSPSPFELTH